MEIYKRDLVTGDWRLLGNIISIEGDKVTFMLAKEFGEGERWLLLSRGNYLIR